MMGIELATRPRRADPIALRHPHKRKLRVVVLGAEPPAADLGAHNGRQLVPLAPAGLQLEREALHAARQARARVPRVAHPQRLVALPVPPVGVAQRQRQLARRQRPRRQRPQRPRQPPPVALQRVHLREDLRALGRPRRRRVRLHARVQQRFRGGRHVVEACGC